MNNYLLVFLGGGIGSVGRYFLSNIFSSIVGIYSIAVINIIGSFLIGVLYSYISQKYSNLSYFLLIGLLADLLHFLLFQLIS